MKSFSCCVALCAAFIAIGLCGCGGSSDTGDAGKGEADLACTQVAQPGTSSARPGIIVYVTDEATGQPVFEGTVVTITDGDYTETLRGSINTGVMGVSVTASFAGAYERPGTYAVNITNPNYATVKKTITVKRDTVTMDTCHVGIQSLSIVLKAK